MKVSLTSITKPVVDGIETAEDFITYCARVSAPKNQLNIETSPKLLAYLIKHKHWSPFDMVNVCFEIETSRAIGEQILRHQSAKYQVFSQRYSNVEELADCQQPLELRMSGSTNRQSSLKCTDEELQKQIDKIAQDSLNASVSAYEKLIKLGVAPESARFVLPLNTTTRIYMNASVRTLIHYMDVRCDEHTQFEHRLVADAIREQFKIYFPNISTALGLI